ncbi:PucR family transcriptional regulator [Gulosibacter molinativorax]|nr:helix-turn-helix domain-containing protein [Gulosibacter molinativorax]QUY63208.1 Hypotetical protein [Gulosibacter molinativorax]
MANHLLDPTDADQSRWVAVLERVSPEELVERFVDQVRQIDDYANPTVTWAEIRSTALASFVALLDALKRDDHALTEDISTHVGVTRARAEVPMSSLMTAIRVDFQVLWNSIIEVAEDSDAELLIRHANSVWTTVDNYVRQTQLAYMAEEKRMEEEAGSTRRKLLAELLRREELSPQRLEVIGDALGLAADGTFAVAAANEDEAAITALRTKITRLERAGLSPFAQYLDTALVLFVAVPPAPSIAQQLGLDALQQLPIGLIPRAETLAGLRHAVPLAIQLAQLVSKDAVTPELGWTRLIHDRVTELNLGTFLDVHPQLAVCGAAERKNLLAAVRAYLQTGSVSEAAEATFCHRNTLTNRLQRFRELTGLDVTVPQQAALLVVLWA